MSAQVMVHWIRLRHTTKEVLIATNSARNLSALNSGRYTRSIMARFNVCPLQGLRTHTTSSVTDRSKRNHFKPNHRNESKSNNKTHNKNTNKQHNHNRNRNNTSNIPRMASLLDSPSSSFSSRLQFDTHSSESTDSKGLSFTLEDEHKNDESVDTSVPNKRKSKWGNLLQSASANRVSLDTPVKSKSKSKTNPSLSTLPLPKKSFKPKKEKENRTLLNAFKFENPIFETDEDLFNHVDWSERDQNTMENRQERRMKRNLRKQAKALPKIEVVPQEIEIPTRISVHQLAEKMSLKTKFVLKALRDLGEHGLQEDSIIFNDVAELVVESLQMIPVLLPPDFLDVELTVPPIDCTAFPTRPPVISVMGHVDHGKTTLLDALRQSKVAASEAGGITQSIGAFSVSVKVGDDENKHMTFIDTPGHAAFSSMRSMGSEVTDMIVLVVAADDGVQPQTIEVIELAQKNNVPLVVAVTKLDMHDHNEQEVVVKIGAQLLRRGVVIESLGGDVPLVCVSGKTGHGLVSLQETIALHAEVMDLRADSNAKGEAVVLEAKISRGVGTQVDTIVKWGTLKTGTFVVCGMEYGRIKALIGPDGKRQKTATPGTPIRVIGLKGIPNTGDSLLTVENEDRAKEIVMARGEIAEWDKLADAEEEAARLAQENDGGGFIHLRRRRKMGANAKSRELEERRKLYDQEVKRIASLKLGEEGYVAKIVPIIVKTDSMGVISAIDDLISRLPTDEVVVKRIVGAVGPVSSSDVALAQATGATIFHFNVRHSAAIDQEALHHEVALRHHTVIYSLLDDITALLQDNQEGEEELTVLGSAEIVQSIPITVKGRRTVLIAGCKVLTGTLTMQAKYRLVRDGTIVNDEIDMETMRHFQDKVSEVTKGQECGLHLKGLEDFQKGDVLEAYTVKIVKKNV